MALLYWLGSRIKHDPNDFGYTRSQLRVVARLYMMDRRTLKDISFDMEISASNLSTMMKDLETDGIIIREPDESDRRLVWYSLSKEGKKLGASVLQMAHIKIEELFFDMTESDEKKLTTALQSMNEVLIKLKQSKE